MNATNANTDIPLCSISRKLSPNILKLTQGNSGKHPAHIIRIPPHRVLGLVYYKINRVCHQIGLSAASMPHIAFA